MRFTSKWYMDKDQTTTPGTTCPTLYDECVGSLTSPASHYSEDAGDGAYGAYGDRLCLAFYFISENLKSERFKSRRNVKITRAIPCVADVSEKVREGERNCERVRNIRSRGGRREKERFFAHPGALLRSLVCSIFAWRKKRNVCLAG